jgi:hypothetical protein
MTDTPRRDRGRPKGSEIDDGKALSQIADILVEGRAHNVAASVRLLAGHDPSLIRRLQRKFRRDRERLLMAARDKADQLALQEGVREDQIQRATQPLSWRHEHDATTQLMDAVNLERQETLKKAFVRG